MPVEQELPWHPVASGLAGQVLPCVVAASHAHALRSSTFWFPAPAILAASPTSLPLASLSAALSLVPPGVAPVSCVAVLLLPLSVGAPGWRLSPPHKDFAFPHDVYYPARGGLVTSLLHPHGGHLPARRVQPPALWSSRAPHGGKGGAWLLMARSASAAFGGCCGARSVWSPYASPCSSCPAGACLTTVWGAALFPVDWLRACLPTWCSFPFCWRAHCCRCALWEG